MEPTPILEITDLVISPAGELGSCRSDRLAIMCGDTIAIDASAAINCRKLLRILATLEPPERGKYRFNGIALDVSDYRQCLAVKRQIGYLTTDAVMVSNRTIRENLLLTRYYYENDLTIGIDTTLAALCESAGLSDQLNRRPAELNEADLKKLIAIREMGKRPHLMLIDRPENFMGLGPDDAIFAHLKNMVQSGLAVVFYSADHEMTGFARRQMTVSDDTIRIRNIRAQRTPSAR